MDRLTPPPVELIWYAFRFALGRDKYSPEIMVDYLVRNYPNIPSCDMYVFEDEVQKFLETCTDQWQIDTWKKVLYLYDKKYHVRVRRKSGQVINAIKMDGGFYAPDFSCMYKHVKHYGNGWIQERQPQRELHTNQT